MWSDPRDSQSLILTQDDKLYSVALKHSGRTLLVVSALAVLLFGAPLNPVSAEAEPSPEDILRMSERDAPLSEENAFRMSALEALEAIDHRLQEQGLTLNLSEVKGPVMDALQKTEFLQQLSGKVFLTHHQAVNSLKPDEIEPYII